MLFFPKHILTVGGEVFNAQNYEFPKFTYQLSSFPVAYYPPPSKTDESALISALADFIIAQREKTIGIQNVNEDDILDDLKSGIQKLKLEETQRFQTPIQKSFPESLSRLINDNSVGSSTVRTALIQHFTTQASQWRSAFKPPPSEEDRLFSEIFDAKVTAPNDNGIKKIWEQKLPQWLTGNVNAMPITLLRNDYLAHEGSQGSVVNTPSYVKAIYYRSDQTNAELVKTIMEETLHIAQEKSTYWNKHFIEARKAATAFKNRISARGVDSKLDQSPEVKRSRRLLKRNMDIDNNLPFWKYDTIVNATELVVDMAFIESQLLGGATFGKRLSQEKVNKIMAEYFPEMYPHYKAFINECIEGTVKNLPDDMHADEKQRLEKQWKASPFGEFAKEAYKPAGGKRHKG